VDCITFKIGEEGETWVIEYLKQQGCTVIDLRSIPEYQARDIDIAIFTPDGLWRDIRIKTDAKMHRTGNILMELSMVRKTGEYPGWFYKCEAAILCYVDEHSGNLFFLPGPKLHDYVTTLIEKDPSCIYNFKTPYDADCIGKSALLNVKKHLLPNKLILKIAHSETIKRAAACRAAGIEYRKGTESSTLVIPA